MKLNESARVEIHICVIVYADRRRGELQQDSRGLTFRSRKTMLQIIRATYGECTGRITGISYTQDR